MDVSSLLNELGSAVANAKAKADVVAALKSELASYTAGMQADIDAASQEYADAKVAAERLQVQWKDAVGELLPATDPRFRVSA